MVFYHKIFPSMKSREKKVVQTADLESNQERKIRWRSIRIVYFSMFMFSLSLSMSMTGIWPYLNKLDPSAGKEFLGLIVGAGALGQMIFSPIFGYWGNHAKNVRLPLIVALPITTLAYVGNALLEVFPVHTVRYWMLFFRFSIGASTASSVVCRSYIAEATTIRERTGVISMISLSLGLGMMLGQVSLVALTSTLGDEGIPLFGGSLWLNTYTAAGWISAVMHVVIFGVLVWPNMFIEQRIAIREAAAKHKESLEKQLQPEVYTLDYIAIYSVMVAFFVISISVFEALGASLAMDQFAWSREEALKFMSILMTCGGICNIVVVSIIKPLCRRFDERTILIYLGFAVTALSQFVNIPWNGDTPQLLLTNATTTNSTALGCPVEKQLWCATVPAITVTQVVIGYFVVSIGRASSGTLCQTIFSKVLGPRPQGVWVGVMMSSSCLARVLSPIIITSIYVRLGPIWTFSMTGGILSLCCVWLHLVRTRLVPPRAADECTRHVEPQDEELQKLWTPDRKVHIVAMDVEKSFRVFSNVR